MELSRPLLKLPIRFDADALARDVRALPRSAWTAHPTGFEGNEAVRLITPRGEETDDLKGEMAPTAHLLASPYIMQVMASIGSVWGRSRLMGLGAGADVPMHVDSHYYWRTHWRIHIPVITNPHVLFSCGPETVHMAAGQCWVFDSFRAHKVHNGGTEQRIHLVLDTVGGGRLRELIDAAEAGATEGEFVVPGVAGPLAYERVNSPTIMSPWEIRAHVAYLVDHVVSHPLLAPVLRQLDDFAADWAAIWAEYETHEEGWPHYLRLVEQLKVDLAASGGGAITLKNSLRFFQVLDHMVLLNLFADADAVAAKATAVEASRRKLAS